MKTGFHSTGETYMRNAGFRTGLEAIGVTLADPEKMYDGHYGLLEEKFDKPLLGKNFFCPFCEGSNALEVRNPHGVNYDLSIYLGCVNLCQVKNCRIEKRQMLTKPFNCTDVGADFSYANAKLSDLAEKQPKVFGDLSRLVAAGQGQLLLAGETGRGKTYAACAALNEAQKRGKSGLYVSLSQVFYEWLECFNAKTRFELLDKIKNREFVIIDDMGVKAPSDSFLEICYLIADTRYSGRNRLMTVYTTNKTSDELLRMFGDPILSRIAGGTCIKMEGKDRRMTF